MNNHLKYFGNSNPPSEPGTAAQGIPSSGLMGNEGSSELSHATASLASHEHTSAVLTRQWLENLPSYLSAYVTILLSTGPENDEWTKLYRNSATLQRLGEMTLLLVDQVLACPLQSKLPIHGTVSRSEIVPLAELYAREVHPRLTELMHILACALQEMPEPLMNASSQLIADIRLLQGSERPPTREINSVTERKLLYLSSLHDRVVVAASPGEMKVELSLPQCAVYATVYHPTETGIHFAASTESYALKTDPTRTRNTIAALVDSTLAISLEYRALLRNELGADAPLLGSSQVSGRNVEAELTFALSAPPLYVECIDSSTLSIRIPFIESFLPGLTKLREKVTEILEPFQVACSSLGLTLEVPRPRSWSLSRDSTEGATTYVYEFLVKVPQELVDKGVLVLDPLRTVVGDTISKPFHLRPNNAFDTASFLKDFGFPRVTDSGREYTFVLLNDPDSDEEQHSADPLFELSPHTDRNTKPLEFLRKHPSLLGTINTFVDLHPAIDLVVLSTSSLHLHDRELTALQTSFGDIARVEDPKDLGGRIYINLLNTEDAVRFKRQCAQYELERFYNQLARFHCGVPDSGELFQPRPRFSEPTLLSLPADAALDPNIFDKFTSLLKTSYVRRGDFCTESNKLSLFLDTLLGFLSTSAPRYTDEESYEYWVEAQVPYAMVGVSFSGERGRIAINGGVTLRNQEGDAIVEGISLFNGTYEAFEVLLPPLQQRAMNQAARELTATLRNIFDSDGTISSFRLIESLDENSISVPDELLEALRRRFEYLRYTFSDKPELADVVLVLERFIRQHPGSSIDCRNGIAITLPTYPPLPRR